MRIPVVLAILAAFGLLGWRRAGLLAWAVAWLAGFWVALRFGFTVPIPASVINLYMGIAAVSVLAFVTSSADRRAAVADPIVRLVTDPRLRVLLAFLVVLFPALAAASVWHRMTRPVEAPFFARTIHPASPSTITVHGTEFDLDGGENPLRALETSDPEAFRAHVESGRRVYYRNCHFCHGDNMTGNGMFVHGLNPIPTNFADAGAIAMLRETFLFWRIAKGGPGLPDEGGPWATAMPAWEKILTAQEIWEVTLFLYDYTGQKPREKEEVH